jgi:hypothetical protein
MHGRVMIGIICAAALVLVSGAVATYVFAPAGSAQVRPEPRAVGAELQAPASGGAGIAAADGFVYVVDSGRVYKLDGDSLEVVKVAAYAVAGGGSTPARRITTPSSGAGHPEKPK